MQYGPEEACEINEATIPEITKKYDVEDPRVLRNDWYFVGEIGSVSWFAILSPDRFNARYEYSTDSANGVFTPVTRKVTVTTA